jgi:hypothetical protein
LRQFRFLLKCEMYFHDAQNTGKPGAWQGYHAGKPHSE